MEIKTVIEIKRYGDYDILYTECIMGSPDIRDADDILKTYCNLRGFPKTDGSGLPYNVLNDVTADFVTLKKQNFRIIKTNNIIFSD